MMKNMKIKYNLFFENQEMAKKYPVVQIVGEKCMSMEPVVEKSEPLKILTELH